jgi:two-component system OmpR family response regulator
MTSVLIVDDDLQLLRVLSWTLKSEGYEVQVASNGGQALAVIESNPPDLMVLDLNMPGLNGREVYGRARASGYEGPVAICSAFGATHARAELGAQAAISKPFEPEELLSVVDRLIHSDPWSPQARLN